MEVFGVESLKSLIVTLPDPLPFAHTWWFCWYRWRRSSLLRKLYCLTVRTLRKWVSPTCYILLTCCRWWHLIRYHHPTIFVCHIISVPNKKRRYQFYCAWSVSGITFINYAVYRNMQTSNNVPLLMPTYVMHCSAPVQK
jgi:hypothetical protein